MSMMQITPAAVLAVDLSLIKKNMVIDGDYMDDIITGWARGVIATLEHKIGQCLMAQTWRVTRDAFAEEIILPHPVLGVVSVKYVDVAGAEQVLATDAYRVRASRYESVLVPARGERWPATLADTDVVVIEVQCGYGTTPAATPPDIQLYILAKMVEQFDPAAKAERDTTQSVFVERLLDARRTYA